MDIIFKQSGVNLRKFLFNHMQMDNNNNNNNNNNFFSNCKG